MIFIKMQFSNKCSKDNSFAIATFPDTITQTEIDNYVFDVARLYTRYIDGVLNEDASVDEINLYFENILYIWDYINKEEAKKYGYIEA